MLVSWWSFAVKGFWALWDMFMNLRCNNRCHGNVLKGLWALCLLSICWLVGGHLLSRDFGSYGINCCHGNADDTHRPDNGGSKHL
jgi:hypothetical protein